MRRPWYRPSLTMQIMIGLVIGIVIGWLRPDWGNAVYFLRDIFLNLIKSIIGPLVFSTLVVGIAGGGNLRKVGRMGVKALVYFEIITTAALFIGLAVVNIAKPGIGVPLIGNQSEVVQKIGETHPSTLIETLVHVFPSSVIDSLVRGDILQIVAFAVLFAMAVSAVGEKGKPVLRAMESLSQVMFKFTNYVMRFAPFGVGAAMAHTIASQGPRVLVSLGHLIFYILRRAFDFHHLDLWTRYIHRADSDPPIRSRRTRARHHRVRNDEQRIGHAESDASNGAARRAEAYRRFRYADGLLVQSRRLDDFPGDHVGVYCTSRRINDRPAFRIWSTAHHDADVHGDVERTRWCAAFIDSCFACNIVERLARNDRRTWRSYLVRHRCIDGHGSLGHEPDWELSGYCCDRALGARVRR